MTSTNGSSSSSFVAHHHHQDKPKSIPAGILPEQRHYHGLPLPGLPPPQQQRPPHLQRPTVTMATLPSQLLFSSGAMAHRTNHRTGSSSSSITFDPDAWLSRLQQQQHSPGGRGQDRNRNSDCPSNSSNIGTTTPVVRKGHWALPQRRHTVRSEQPSLIVGDSEEIHNTVTMMTMTNSREHSNTNTNTNHHHHHHHHHNQDDQFESQSMHHNRPPPMTTNVAVVSQPSLQQQHQQHQQHQQPSQQNVETILPEESASSSSFISQGDYMDDAQLETLLNNFSSLSSSSPSASVVVVPTTTAAGGESSTTTSTSQSQKQQQQQPQDATGVLSRCVCCRQVLLPSTSTAGSTRTATTPSSSSTSSNQSQQQQQQQCFFLTCDVEKFQDDDDDDITSIIPITSHRYCLCCIRQYSLSIRTRKVSLPSSSSLGSSSSSSSLKNFISIPCFFHATTQQPSKTDKCAGTILVNLDIL